MALIKSSKFRHSDDESDPKSGQVKEEPTRKRGLIKGKIYRKTFPDTPLTNSKPSQRATPPRRRKILKSRNSPIMKAIELGEANLPKAPDTRILTDSSFFSASFIKKTGSLDGKGSLKDMVMIPSSEKIKTPPPEKVQELEEEVTSPQSQPEEFEFKIEEPQPTPTIDIDAIISEAEERGREKAARIVGHAQAEAKKLIDQAKIYGETVKTEAQKEGMKQGKEDGYKSALEEFTTIMEEAKKLFTQLVSERRRILDEIEPELAKLSISIAEKIIGNEIKTNLDTVVNIARQAMSKMRSREKVNLKVHPDDLEYVKENREVFVSLVDNIKDFEIEGNPKVDPGGCIISTSLGNADARIKTQLEAIELAFKNVENS